MTDATSITPELSIHRSNAPDIEAITALADRARLTEPVDLCEVSDDVHAHAFVVPDDHRVELVDLHQFDVHRAHPRRSTGTRVLHDIPHFNDALARYGNASITTVWADQGAAQITAVLNDEGIMGEPGWGDDRLILPLQLTREWQHWASNDRAWLDQEEFADHIDLGSRQVIDPDAATMLELAMNFRAASSVDYKSHRRLDSGQAQLVYDETIDAKVGRSGDITIPTRIRLTLRPYKASTDEWTIEAWFRYRIVSGHLKLSYVLIRPDDVLDEAFDQLITGIADGLDMPVFRGTPSKAHA